MILCGNCGRVSTVGVKAKPRKTVIDSDGKIPAGQHDTLCPHCEAVVERTLDVKGKAVKVTPDLDADRLASPTVRRPA